MLSHAHGCTTQEPKSSGARVSLQGETRALSSVHQFRSPTRRSAMLWFLIGIGLTSLAIMVTVDGVLAEFQQRQAQTTAIVSAGTLGLMFFLALLYAGGGTP